MEYKKYIFATNKQPYTTTWENGAKTSQGEVNSVFNSFSPKPLEFCFSDSSQNTKCYDCIQDVKETFIESPTNGWIKKNS